MGGREGKRPQGPKRASRGHRPGARAVRPHITAGERAAISARGWAVVPCLPWRCPAWGGTVGGCLGRLDFAPSGFYKIGGCDERVKGGVQAMEGCSGQHGG